VRRLVVDASVIAKCFIAEDDSDKAFELMVAHSEGRLALSAPSLIVYELGNVFWRHPQISPEKAYTFIEKFLDLQIDLVDIWTDNELLKAACTTAKTRDVTFYDASYLSLAEKEKARLVTADEDITARAEDKTILLGTFRA